MLDQIRQIRATIAQELPEDAGRELQQQVDSMESAVSYAVMADEIRAAGQELEAHRADFAEMMRDPASAMERAVHLFSEERFADLRFTIEELRGAFDQVGYPSLAPQGLEDEDMEILVAAAIHLAGDEAQRLDLSRRLMMAMPDYVSAGRYRDAWLIQHSAFRLNELPHESNPFMFVMTELALEAWDQEMEREQNALMEALGFDTALRGRMSLEEARVLAQEVMEDPLKMAHLERFAADHPDLAAQFEAQMRRHEMEAVKLLEREDAECLLLSPEEAEPLMPKLAADMEALRDRMGEDFEGNGEPDPSVREEALDAFNAMCAEMAREIYTRERVDQLVQELRDYQRRLSAAGEEEAAEWVDSAVMAARRNEPAHENPFLLATCFASLRGWMKAALEDATERQAPE